MANAPLDIKNKMDDIKQEIERKGIEPTQEDGLNFVKHIMQSFLLPKLKNKLSPKAYNEYKQQIDEALERIKAATFQNQQLPEMIKIDDEIKHNNDLMNNIDKDKSFIDKGKNESENN
ncbi:hypothetical protein ['Catharanthus roseus' aster yellows phytoplasma]|uniref:Uncharacterized protein n=1 Tax='Catharanthus roseus' aster yellows phytoplasma TaxID=1193712 RepID=A0A4P6MAH8_9MOLU|nr:hypothetical protein ['Catharanthus roseus' aster yellows phytoplasma]QBF23830.1 hypothetical protein EXT02_01310 ['Catharanthus roseus' aster yellows phytoplasma]